LLRNNGRRSQQQSCYEKRLDFHGCLRGP
jgi:hypothetical protein